MKYQLTAHIRRHTNQQLLDDLCKTARKIRKTTISNKQYRQIGHFDPSVIIRRFSSWNNALIQAGLTVSKHYNVTASQLLDNLQHLWHSLGRQPYLSDLFPPLSRFSRRPYLREFGTWSNALETFVSTRQKPSKGITCVAVVAKQPVRAHKRHINWRLRHLVMKRDNFRCRACGVSPATHPGITLHIDHIIPVSKGGPSTIDNLQTRCQSCNIGKSNL